MIYILKNMFFQFCYITAVLALYEQFDLDFNTVILYSITLTGLTACIIMKISEEE